MSFTVTRRHQRVSRATPRRKSSALIASSVALMAPADVPQITGNGMRALRPTMCAIARNAPT